MIYILNLVRALNFLEDDEKPEIIIFHGFQSPVQDLLNIKYPYLKLHQVNSKNYFKKIFFRVKRFVTGKSAFYDLLPEVVYPYNPIIFDGKPRIDWIPDFQERYLPQMFSEAEIEKRKRLQSKIAESGGTVVFSSEDAKNDFQKFYPHHNCQLRLIRFASILPDFSQQDIGVLRKKYDLGEVYFMSPNQFWKHKNHMVVLQAIAALKPHNLDFQVAFSGGQSDPRNKDYFQSLQNYIDAQGIQRWVRFLGFIDRGEQLCLMANARAIVQPSLFEGWSTVVEDSKALNQFVLLSDLNVHKEQVSENYRLFDPHSPSELAENIKELVENKPAIKPADYSRSVKDFLHNILKVLGTNG